MLAPLLSISDIAGAMRRLLPRGRAWPRDNDSTQWEVLQGLAPTYQRLAARDVNLLTDSFPLTTVELLPEWEASLGLPDPCAGPSPTIQQRRAQVVARFAGNGGQAAAYFIEYAANLGYTIGVQNFAPFRVGFNCAGQPLYGEAPTNYFRAGIGRAGDPLAFWGYSWAYVWAITAPLNQEVFFRTGVSAVGEPLATWGNAVLECEMNAIKPAHMILLFEYS